MTKKVLPLVTLKLGHIVGGGQTISTMESGQKLFTWGGIPDETVQVQITKKKSKLLEGIVTELINPSQQRVAARDADSYLSTSPWQIMNFAAEQHYKSALIEEAFELHNIVLPEAIEVYTDNKEYGYRNKIEFSWWWTPESDTLDLAFFKRGSHGRIPVKGTSLANPAINRAAIVIRDLLRSKSDIRASMLKTLLLRCDAKGNVVAQLYVKESDFQPLTDEDVETLATNNVKGFELIYSNPKSPASVITKRLQSWGTTTLTDRILDTKFTYATEGFFQINLSVYEQALIDMKQWVNPDSPTIDLYSGVGTIGLTIGSPNTTMIEINEHAFGEMKQNIRSLGREKDVRTVLAASESALEYIDSDSTIIVDPPRAGLHTDVVNKLLETSPKRIIYLSCNPVTQARDVALLSDKYGIKYHCGYNFFPKTPHIEHLVILDLK